MQQKTKYKMNIWISAMIALIYLIIPADFLPDVVPVTGWIDDLVAILLALTNALIFASKLRKGN